MCFIDFKKAFDSVWHQGMLFKLLQNKIGGKVYYKIKSMYSKSKCYIKLGAKRTGYFEYARGVRQRCILSPLLFNLYLNELPNLIKDSTSLTDPFILPNRTKLSTLLYADALILLSKSKHELQNCINNVASFCNTWQLSVNRKKTKVMIFAKKSAKSSKQQDFHLFNNKLDIVQEYTYLGLKLSSTGNFTTNQTQSREKAWHAFYNLTRIIDLKRLKPKHANKLFETLIVPILSYGCEVWGAYLKQTFQNWEKSPIEKVHLRFWQSDKYCLQI